MEEICLPYAAQFKNGFLSRFGYIFGYTTLKDPSIRTGKNNPNKSYTSGNYVPGGTIYQDFYIPAIYGGNTYIYTYYYFYIPSSLKKVTVTKDSSIPERCFYNCKNLTSIILPDEITAIDSYAFYNCNNLTNITIPENVTSIGDWAFSYCTGLDNVIIPKNVNKIGNAAFYSCTGLKSIMIPQSVASIEDGTFSYCTGLTDVLIPESVTTIGERAFYGCTSLNKIRIPKNVSSIGNSAFTKCTGLSGVYITDLSAWCNINFGTGNDYGNPLGCAKKLYINDELVNDIVIPDDVTRIKSAAFYCCDFKSVIIPGSVKEIANNAFSGKINKIYLHSSLSSAKSSLNRNVTGDIYMYDYIVSYVLDNKTLLTDYVESGTDSIPPVAPEGYTYKFFVDDAIWNGENVISDTVVKVIMLNTPSENKISMSCVDLSYDQNAVNAHYYLLSEDKTNMCGIFYLAAYNDRGYLVGIYQEEINTDKTEYDVQTSIEVNEMPTYFKAFVWGGESKMLPCGKSITTDTIS